MKMKLAVRFGLLPSVILAVVLSGLGCDYSKSAARPIASGEAVETGKVFENRPAEFPTTIHSIDTIAPEATREEAKEEERDLKPLDGPLAGHALSIPELPREEPETSPETPVDTRFPEDRRIPGIDRVLDVSLQPTEETSATIDTNVSKSLVVAIKGDDGSLSFLVGPSKAGESWRDYAVSIPVSGARYSGKIHLLYQKNAGRITVIGNREDKLYQTYCALGELIRGKNGCVTQEIPVAGNVAWADPLGKPIVAASPWAFVDDYERIHIFVEAPYDLWAFSQYQIQKPTTHLSGFGGGDAFRSDQPFATEDARSGILKDTCGLMGSEPVITRFDNGGKGAYHIVAGMGLRRTDAFGWPQQTETGSSLLWVTYSEGRWGCHHVRLPQEYAWYTKMAPKAVSRDGDQVVIFTTRDAKQSGATISTDLVSWVLDPGGDGVFLRDPRLNRNRSGFMLTNVSAQAYRTLSGKSVLFSSTADAEGGCTDRWRRTEPITDALTDPSCHYSVAYHPKVRLYAERDQAIDAAVSGDDPTENRSEMLRQVGMTAALFITDEGELHLFRRASYSKDLFHSATDLQADGSPVGQGYANRGLIRPGEVLANVPSGLEEPAVVQVVNP